MTHDKVPIADLKARLSEYVTLAKSEGRRIVITKRGKSVAALIGINDYNMLQELQERRSLADIATGNRTFSAMYLFDTDSVTNLCQTFPFRRANQKDKKNPTGTAIYINDYDL